MKDELLLNILMEEHFSIPGKMLEHYKDLGLSEIQLMIIFHIKHFLQNGVLFPTPALIQSRMNITEERCTHELKELSKRGFLHIEERRDVDGKMSEAYSLLPLYEKLTILLMNQSIDNEKQSIKNEEGRLFQRFEEEFARPITPMELEMISMWLDDDKHSPMMIEAALREAVISAKLSFRYIDRILIDWKKNGIRTLEQAKEHGERIRQRHLKAYDADKERDVNSKRMSDPQYDWLRGN